MPIELTVENRTKLRGYLVDYFSEPELDTICVDLGVDFEKIPGRGQGKDARALHIVDYFEKRGRIEDLVHICRLLRKNVDWNSLFVEKPLNASTKGRPRDARVEHTVQTNQSSNITTKQIQGTPVKSANSVLSDPAPKSQSSTSVEVESGANSSPSFFTRAIVNAVSIASMAYLVPGITVNGGIGTYLILALIFGIVNALIRPIIKLLTCPLIILTLGLFILVINGAMLMLTGAISGDRLMVAGWGSAILGGIIMGIVNVILEAVTGPNKSE